MNTMGSKAAEVFRSQLIRILTDATNFYTQTPGYTHPDQEHSPHNIKDRSVAEHPVLGCRPRQPT
jgi:hypothetical protein